MEQGTFIYKRQHGAKKKMLYNIEHGNRDILYYTQHET